MQAFIGAPIKFLRLPALVMFFFKNLKTKSARAKRRFWANQQDRYADMIPDLSITMVRRLDDVLVNEAV